MSETLRRYPRVYYELVLIGFSLTLGMGLQRAFLPILATELDPRGILVGIVSGAWFLPRIFIEIPSGVISDRIGRSRILVFGLFLSAFGAFLCATSSSIEQLIFGQGLWGLGIAFFYANNTALIFDLFESRRRGKALGTLTGIQFVGSFIGAPIGAVIASLLDYYSVFYVASTMTIISFFVAFLSRDLKQASDKTRRIRKKISVGKIFQSLRNWEISIVCFSFLVRAMVIGGTMHTIFPLFLSEVHFYSIESIGIVISARIAGFILGNFSSGRLADHFGAKSSIIVGLAINALCLCFYTVKGFFVLMMFIGILDGFAAAVVLINLTILLPSLVADDVRGAAIGLYRTFMAIGATAGPIFFMFFYQLIGKHMSFLIAAALFIACIPLIVSLHIFSPPRNRS